VGPGRRHILGGRVHRRCAPRTKGRRCAAMWCHSPFQPRIVCLTAALLVSTLAPALAESAYPDHAVRVIVPFAPGGVVDVMARLLSQKLSADVGKNFYLQN